MSTLASVIDWIMSERYSPGFIFITCELPPPEAEALTKKLTHAVRNASMVTYDVSSASTNSVTSPEKIVFLLSPSHIEILESLIDNPKEPVG